VRSRAAVPKPAGRRGCGERGETLIEFAFASVIFLMMMFGAIEFGIAIWNFNLVSDLAQEGARYAAVHGQNSGSPRTTAQLAAFIDSRAIGLPVTTTTPLGAPNTKAAGTIVEVNVSHTLNWGGGLLPLWNFPVSSSARMIVAR
jgi:Flp pilus assembly protein TadG